MSGSAWPPAGADRYEVTALVRANDKAAALERQGLKTVVIDLVGRGVGASAPERLDQEAIVYLAPPPGSGESDLRLDRFLHLAFVPPKSFVYMSTTGVYGDAEAAWSTKARPSCHGPIEPGGG